MRIPLIAKLMTAIAVLVLLPAAVFLLYTYNESRKSATEIELQRIRNYSDNIAGEIDSFIVSQQNLARFATVSNELKRALANVNRPHGADEFSQWLSHWKGISDYIDEVFVLDTTGKCVSASNPGFVGQSYAFRTYFKAGLAGEHHVSDWTVGVTSKKPGIYLSSPIQLGEQIRGVLVIKLDMAPIDRIIKRSSDLGIQSFVANNAGVLLAHYDKNLRYATVGDLTEAERSAIAASKQFAGIEQPSLKLASLRNDLARVRPGETTTSEVYAFQNEQKIAALTGTHARPWVAGVTVPRSVIEASANQLLYSFLPLAGVILAFTAIASFYISRYLVQPLHLLLAAVTRFGAGDQAARAHTGGQDEVGRLAAAFDDMAGRIATQTNELEQRVAERTLELRGAYERIKLISITDPLTACFNRRHMDEQLANELARAKRYDFQLSVMMCDIDFFKRVNDTHGHQAGDRVLMEISSVLRAGLRQEIDWAARFGGEEFVLVLPETSGESAAVVAERLRQAIEHCTITYEGKSLKVTASFGLTSSHRDQSEAVDTVDTILARADGLLYQAKKTGRNRVVAG